jgi:4-oxalocrotonate tautomerase
MPFINIDVPVSLTPEIKAKLVRDVVDGTHRAVGSDPAIINVVIHELPPANVSVGGNVVIP